MSSARPAGAAAMGARAVAVVVRAGVVAAGVVAAGAAVACTPTPAPAPAAAAGGPVSDDGGAAHDAPAARGARSISDRTERPRLIDAPAGEVTSVVTAQRAESARAGRRLLVYVGATWCEPCQRFHQAVARHELDDLLAGVDLLVFDLDKDRERLDAAGYGSRLIPLLVVPDGAGRGTARRMEGSIKGPGAVDNMAPRLRALLR